MAQKGEPEIRRAVMAELGFTAPGDLLWKPFPFLGPGLGQDRLLEAQAWDPDSPGLIITQLSCVLP